MAQKQEEQAPVKFKIGDDEYEILDLDELEFREIELIEDAFDRPVEEIDFSRAKAIRWLIYVSMRRSEPDLKFEDLGSLKFSSFEEIEAEPPKRPTKGKAAAKAA